MLRGYAAKIWLITGAGLIARLALIGYQPLWRDEAFTALAVQRPLGSMMDVVRNDSAPPLFYLVERLFAVVSTSPAMLRLFPVLVGTAAIPIVAALGRRIAGDAGGIWAAVIGAVAPALIVSSLDARMYMLATTLVLASTLCLLRALERPSAVRWALYVVFSILAVYTVYFALFAVFAQVVAVAVIHRHTLRRVVLMAALGAATLASLIPWIIAARAQLTHSAGAFWVPKLSIRSVFGGLEQFFTGPPLNTWVNGYAALRALEVAGDVAGCLVLVALFAYRRQLSAAGAATARFPLARGRDRRRRDAPRQLLSPARGREVPEHGVGAALSAPGRRARDGALASRRVWCRGRDHRGRGGHGARDHQPGDAACRHRDRANVAG